MSLSRSFPPIFSSSTRRSTSEQQQDFPHDYDATIVATTEDLDVPRHSRASSSSKQSAAASRVLPVSKLGSLGNSPTDVLADYDSVDNLNSSRETCADLDRETIFSTLFMSESKGKKDRDQNVLQSLRDMANVHKILERKAELAVRREKMAQQKLFEGEADVEVKQWDKRNSDMTLCEVNQEFESQRIQLQQTNRCADWAQRGKISL